MHAVQWNDSLSVGVKLIDQQHKQWIRYLNEVAEAVQAHIGPSQVGRTLEFLIEYTDFHFGTEEKHMAATLYPDLDAHRAKHEEMKLTLAGLVQDFEEEGATQILSEAINTLLGNWLIQHISDVDRRFGQYLREKGIELEE